MKSRIKYSTYATVITAIIIVVLVAGIVVCRQSKPAMFTLVAITLSVIVLALFYGALAIKADPRYVRLVSPLHSKKIATADIKSVEPFQPTMGAIRICASGGFMGYWGLFREGDIGRYYAFYGKASDCLLVRMKNGDKYVIGCQNPTALRTYIAALINP